MARLLTVVNERKRLRTEYRLHLENEYIQKQKEEEMKAFLEKREKLEARGVKNLPKTAEELRAELFAHKDRQAARLKEEREKIKESQLSEETAMAAQLDDKDIDFLASMRVKLSQKEILQMYVGNWMELDLKQRRKVMGYV